MISKYRLRWLMSWPIRAIYQNRTIRVDGEAGVGLHFRPSENPRLLRGVRALESETRHRWSQLIFPGAHIVDLGAHIGITTQRFHGMLDGDCRIWAFEPNPRNYELLQQNTRDLGEQVRTLPYAVGDCDENVVFADNVRHGALSRLETYRIGNRIGTGYWNEARQIEVPMRRLDTLLAEEQHFQPSFMKIDVEGAAALVMDGARETLESFKPTCYCEYHSSVEKAAIRDALGPIGYRGVRFDGANSPAWCDIDSAPHYFVHPDRMTTDVALRIDAPANAIRPTKDGARHSAV